MLYVYSVFLVYFRVEQYMRSKTFCFAYFK